MRLMPAAAVTAVALAFAAMPPLAHAQDEKLKSLIGGKKPKAAPKATSQLGSAKEEPPACPEPAPCPKAPCSEDDVALLRGLQNAFEPAPVEIRVIAVEDLALLQDARALNALAHLALDPDPKVAVAAVETVGHFLHPRAEEILANVIRHPQLAPALKVAAVKALPVQGTPSARELLTEIVNTGRYAPPVTQAARDAIAMMVKR